MRNTPAEQGEGVDNQLDGCGDNPTRNPEKRNVIRFPNERRIARVEVSWVEGFETCVAEMVERKGDRARIAHDRDPAEVLRIIRKFAADLRLPIIDKTDPLRVKVERPTPQNGGHA